MDNGQFLDLLYSNLTLYLSLLGLVFIIYYAWFGNKVRHVADPLMIGFVAQVFSCSVVLLLEFTSEIDDFYFYSFLYTEVMFLIPLLFMRKNYVKINDDSHERFLAYKRWNYGYSSFYYTTTILLIITSIYYFAIVGIPILNQLSRLDTNESAGIISWFTDVYWVCFPAMVAIKRYVYRRKSFVDYVLLLLCFVCLLVKGGKSDFFFMIVSLFLVKEVYQIRELAKVVKILSYISPLIILGLMVVIFSVWGANGSVVSAFFERFVLFGDAFYQGYSKPFMDSLPKDIYVWDYFFGGTINKLSMILGYPVKDKVIFGYEISKYYYNIDSGIGPNARQNILGLYLFGPYFCGVFSFVLGLIYLAIRRGTFLVNNRTRAYSLRVVFYIIFCTYSCYLFIDPTLTWGLYLKTTFVFIFPLIVSLLNQSIYNRRLKGV